ncbi:HPr kinase/phosphorylase [bacterium]|nr:HPr kinase/phosphorylase [bacterium]
MFFQQLKKHSMMKITIRQIFTELKKDLSLTLLAGEEGLENQIIESDLHRPGLALAGFVELFTYHRIQVLGNTEIRYLASMALEQKQKCLEKIFEFNVPCFILTHNNKAPERLLELCKENEIPLFVTPLSTTNFMNLISEHLNEVFAPVEILHGSLVDVYGVGLLLKGRSGIGKSEVALDLVERGHRLVADDIVTTKKIKRNILIGSATERTKNMMEFRGVGLINLRCIFGVRAVRYQKRIEVIVELKEWDPKANFDRLGLDEKVTTILDVKIPTIELPIFPGKNITVIAEVIAMNHLVKYYGYDPATQYTKEIKEKYLQKGLVETFTKNELASYLRGDVE